MPPIMQFAKRAFEYCTWRGLLSPQIVTSLMKDEQESEFTALDDVLKKYTGVLADNLKGATFVAINDRGETLYSRSFGYRTFGTDGNEPLSPDSLLWIASLTKLITSVACMIAVEQGLLTLDENVRNIVPELRELDLLVGFENGESPRKPILKKVTTPLTLRQLLSHQSGFAYDQLHPGLQEWSKYHERTDWTMSGSYGGYTHPLIFEPGSGWVYGCGMDWAGRTIEIVSNMSLEAFMKKHIFDPLRMASTTFHPELRPELLAHQASLAWRDRITGALALGASPWAMPAKDCCGGVGLYSTASDYAKMLGALLGGGKALLSQASIDTILSSQLQDPKYFLEVINGEGKAHLGQTWPVGAHATFGLSASITLEPFPGRRCEGSANWSGMPGLHAWIDRRTGIAGLLTTQVLPPGDPIVTKCFLELETALYKNLRSS